MTDVARRKAIHSVYAAAVALATFAAATSAAPQISAGTPAVRPAFAMSNECQVTSQDNRELWVPRAGGYFREDGMYGNQALYVILGSWIVFQPGSGGWVHADGSLSIKFPWWRLSNGQLVIEGRRLDDEAPPLRAIIPSGYGDSGLQVTSLVFPTPGCWEVTGRVGEESITFVTLIELVGDGPCSKESRAPGETGGQVATKVWREERISDSMHGIREFRVTGEREYDGGSAGIRGFGRFDFVVVRHAGAPAELSGDELITASIGGKKGRFTIRHKGSIERGIVRSDWKIVEQSGSEDFETISGHGRYTSGLDDKACYTVTYSDI